MRHCWLTFISRASGLITAFVLLQVALADAADCDIVRDSIQTGDLLGMAAVAPCASSASSTLQMELVEFALAWRRSNFALAMLEASDLSKVTPALIHAAALYEQPQIVRYLIEVEPGLLESRNQDDWTPLTSAALGRAYMSAKVLLNAGANEDIAQSMIVAVGRSREIAYLIAERHREWMTDENVAGEILASAAQYTDESFLHYLLNLGMQPNLRDADGYYVILRAAVHDDERVGRRNWLYLQSHGADEQRAICSIDDSTVIDIEANAPRWFAQKVSEVRPLCPDE